MRWFVFFMCLFIAAHAFGENKPDSATSEALGQTHDLLTDPHARDKALKDSEKGKAAHEYANRVTGGGGNLEDMYGISSEIFAHLTKEAGGDTQKLQEVLIKAQANPEAFYKSLPEHLRTKVRGLAGKVPQPAKPQN